MSWSAHQVALLHGMGFDTLQLRGAGDYARAPVGAAPAATAPSRARSAGIATDVAPAASSAPAAAATTAGKLLAALRLAAGGHDPIALAGDLDGLRRDPARKRALWPRLRALRRRP